MKKNWDVSSEKSIGGALTSSALATCLVDDPSLLSPTPRSRPGSCWARCKSQRALSSPSPSLSRNITCATTRSTTRCTPPTSRSLPTCCSIRPHSMLSSLPLRRALLCSLRVCMTSTTLASPTSSSSIQAQNSP